MNEGMLQKRWEMFSSYKLQGCAERDTVDGRGIVLSQKKITKHITLPTKFILQMKVIVLLHPCRPVLYDKF